MMRAPESVKRFNSAKKRFLFGVLNNFFKQEFPKLLGPILRKKLVEELIKLLQELLPLREHVKPGQIVWNAVSIKTRADSPNVRFVPVVLTIISEHDIEQLVNGVPMSKIMEQGIARITREAYSQGALLSMRDIGLLVWRSGSDISKYRKNYEEKHDVTLPHTGSLHDMGTCISHKAIIIKKIMLERKDPLVVAQETNHSIRAVDHYIKDFNRVKLCYGDGKGIEFICMATGLTKSVVNQYLRIIRQLQKDAEEPGSMSLSQEVSGQRSAPGRSPKKLKTGERSGSAPTATCTGARPDTSLFKHPKETDYVPENV